MPGTARLGDMLFFHKALLAAPTGFCMHVYIYIYIYIYMCVWP